MEVSIFANTLFPLNIEIMIISISWTFYRLQTTPHQNALGVSRPLIAPQVKD